MAKFGNVPKPGSRVATDQDIDDLNSGRKTFDDFKTEKRADSSIDWKPPIPFGAAHGPEFPTDVLPTWLRNYVEALSVFTQTPAGLSAGVVLVLIAVAIHKAFQIQPRPGWNEPLNIYWLGLAEPASRKSAIFQATKTPLDTFERIEAERMAPVIRQARSKFEILAKQRGEFITSVAKAKDASERDHLLRQIAEIDEEIAANPVPAEPRKVVQDVTPERLGTLMLQNDGRIGVIDSEGDFLDIIGGRYANRGQANLGLFLKAHAGDDHRIDRGNRPSEHLRRPAISFGVLAQPAVFDGLLAQPTFRGRGLLGRFLYDKPASNLGNREIDPPEVPFPIEDEYFRQMTRLLKLPVNRDDAGDIAPATIVLPEDAAEIFREVRQGIETDLCEFGRLSSLLDWGGKISGQTARLAGILHVADCVGNEREVSANCAKSAMQGAVELGRYYIEHAVVMFGLMGGEKSKEASKRILHTIRKSEFQTFTKRDLFEKVKGTFPKAEDLDEPLRLLENHGFIADITRPPSGKAGRRPSPTYAVNPHLENDSHYSRNSRNGGAS